MMLAAPSKAGEAAFRFLAWRMAMMVFLLVLLLGWNSSKAGTVAKKFGWRFFVHSIGTRSMATLGRCRLSSGPLFRLCSPC